MNVLIIDDELEICILLQKILETQKLICETANSVCEAKKKIEHKEYNAIIVDLHLSDGSGFDIIKTIKNRKINSKIIIVSAYDSRAEKEKAKKLKVDHFISKPFKRQQIIEAIKTAL